MNDLTKFIISDTQYLKITPESISKDDCEVCAHCDIDYVDEEKNIIIRFGYEQNSTFCYFIAESGYVQELMQEKKILSKNITYDLGFEWNQYFEGIIKKTEVAQYLCWSNSHKQIRPYFSSWMYNDQDGSIVFEITPFYPWNGETKKTCPEKISYKQWIKDYKPTLKIIIPKDRLKKWIPQAKKLKKMLINQN